MTRNEIEELVEELSSGEHLVVILDVSTEEFAQCKDDLEFAKTFLRQKFDSLLEEILPELATTNFTTTKVTKGLN